MVTQLLLTKPLGENSLIKDFRTLWCQGSQLSLSAARAGRQQAHGAYGQDAGSRGGAQAWFPPPSPIPETVTGAGTSCFGQHSHHWLPRSGGGGWSLFPGWPTTWHNFLWLLQIRCRGTWFRSRCRSSSCVPGSGHHGTHSTQQRCHLASARSRVCVLIMPTLGPGLSAVGCLAVIQRRETPGLALASGREHRLQRETAVYSGFYFWVLFFIWQWRNAEYPASVTTGYAGIRGHQCPIRTFGTRWIELCFSGQRFQCDFITTEVAVPILGADFFVFLWSPGGRIINTGPALKMGAMRLTPGKLSIAKATTWSPLGLSNMERLGIICCSSSPWLSPLHMVSEWDGGWRPCGDYCRLNDATTPDRYPVPHIQDFSAHLLDKVDHWLSGSSPHEGRGFSPPVQGPGRAGFSTAGFCMIPAGVCGHEFLPPLHSRSPGEAATDLSFPYRSVSCWGPCSEDFGRVIHPPQRWSMHWCSRLCHIIQLLVLWLWVICTLSL